MTAWVFFPLLGLKETTHTHTNPQRLTWDDKETTAQQEAQFQANIAYKLQAKQILNVYLIVVDW